MRVIGGKVKGHKLRGIEKRTTRAVTGRIKESIFDILGDVSGKRVLDLFAGTGSLGIEALSRGAREAVFIERDRVCVRTIRKNLSVLGLRARIYAEDVKRGLKRVAEKKFDLIFVDPPFAKPVRNGIFNGSGSLAEETLKELAQSKLVDKQGLVIVRHHSKQSLPEEIGGLILGRAEKYGENIVRFYNLDSDIRL
jgi:16S rRNA (guanine(966)-N(2))-methyltransferase RsmD